jgi:hypothetical protein
MVSVVVHANLALENQRETAEWLRQGFARHGITAEITGDKFKAADVHVVQGPHYAWREWLGKPNVLWLDRCFYGDARFDLSIGWLKTDGSRDFKNHGMATANGILPALAPAKESRRHAVIFADYGQINEARHWEVDARNQYQQVYLREHPADRKYRYFYTLEEIWRRCDVAIGGSSTALVQAAIEGLSVISHDASYVVNDISDRHQWLTDLSWAQWGHDQIRRGEFWGHLC